MVAGVIEAPKALTDLHLRKEMVASLVIRTLAAADQLSGAALETRLGVPFETLQPILEEFQKSQLIDASGYASDPGLDGRPVAVRMLYVIGAGGRRRAGELASTQTRYLGPCPISFEDYVELARSQVPTGGNGNQGNLAQALTGLELEPAVVDQIGAAMVSRSSLFLFGAPGNGKSTIAERLALLAGPPIEIPHAVAVGDEVVRVYDPVCHRPATDRPSADQRLVRIQRPVVIAGGEMRQSELELTYDGDGRYYQAPLQWKANCGVLVIDDFGRQEVPPLRILNRFIVPMEKRIDYLDLTASGRKIELPFLCQLVFSTNLPPSSLIDEAFLRRIAYKIGIGNPSVEAYSRIMRAEAERNGIAFDERAVNYLMTLYGSRPLRGSHPRQIISRLVDLASFRGQSPRLTPQTLREAFQACFNPSLGGVIDDDWALPPQSSH